MEALLVQEWLDGRDAIDMRDEASVSLARQRARAVAAAEGFSAEGAERLAMIASELGHNHLRHAAFGVIAVEPVTRSGRRGVEIVAADAGRGIADPSAALRGIARTTGSLGVGLASVRDFATETDFDVRVGEGTCIRARLFEGEAPPRREIGVFGRPLPGEAASGDHAGVVHLDDGVLVGVCDGLGHGPEARDASNRALEVFRAERRGSPERILERCHRSLTRTRGAVMAVARIYAGGSLDVVSVGNIVTEVTGLRASRRVGGSSFVLGGADRRAEFRPMSATLLSEEMLVMFTDGVAARTSIQDDLALAREHPIVIAAQIIARFAQDDDALVLVVRQQQEGDR